MEFGWLDCDKVVLEPAWKFGVAKACAAVGIPGEGKGCVLKLPAENML